MPKAFYSWGGALKLYLPNEKAEAYNRVVVGTKLDVKTCRKNGGYTDADLEVYKTINAVADSLVELAEGADPIGFYAIDNDGCLYEVD